MRWFPFLILAYLFVAVQFALGGILQWHEKTPNLVLLLVIFIGLHAPTEPAMIAGFVLGLMHDVVASHGIGTYTLAYTFVALLAVQLRGVMYADHLVTHVMMTLLLATAVVLYLVFRAWVRHFYYDEPGISFGPRMMSVLATAAIHDPRMPPSQQYHL